MRPPATHVVFDMDGVLLDTEKLYTRATQQIVGRFGKTFDWSVKKDMIGRPALDSARHLVAALALPISPEDYLAERDILFEELMPTAEAMPGARELTSALAARGVPMAVATSSKRPIYEMKTRNHREWFRTFSAVVLGDDPRVRHGKPAPDIFLVAATCLGARPETCVVIEDAPAGARAARAAGMRVVAFPDPGVGRAPFEGMVDLIIDSLIHIEPDVLLA